MKTAIYCRVSTEEQATDGFSINAQKDKLRKYADINDWEIVDFYIDDGISGKNIEERPEIRRLIEDIKNGKVNNILVYKLDRLTRSLKDLIYLIDLFDKYNCTFNSQTEKIDTSNAVGRMFVKIIGIFAEFERENLAERVTFGYEQKTREGNYTNCNGVFGYDYLIGKGRLKVNEYEKCYVNKIFRWYLNGESMFGIAKKLQQENVMTKRGGKWKQSTISSILNNPLYIGNVRYGLHKSNGFEVSGKDIEPIISRKIFYDVQKLLKNRKERKNNKIQIAYFINVLRCSECGGKYRSKSQNKKGVDYITYECKDGRCHCFSQKKIERAFFNYYSKNDITYELDKFIGLGVDDKKSFIEKYVKEIVVGKKDGKIIIEDIVEFV